jgi:cyclopropane fatty-acyl-phospholipid synthase-like methyltransferase
MDNKLSKRLADIVDKLPLKDGLRILEIGCGPGAMAREIVKRIGRGHILAIDRSAKAIQQAIAGSKAEIETGALQFRQIPIENFELEAKEKPFDIAVAVRVGALDGRHPEIEKQALTKIAKALTKKGKLFIDGGNPLKELPLDKFRADGPPKKTKYEA